MRLCELLPDCCPEPPELPELLPELPELALRPELPLPPELPLAPDIESPPELPDESLEPPLLRSSLRSAIVYVLRV